MSEQVGKSIEKLDGSAKDMIKFNTTIVTVLTALATYFRVASVFLIAPIILIAIGILAFIVTVQPIGNKYIVGEVTSSEKAYSNAVNRKSKFLKIGYAFTYVGFIWFLFVVVA